MLYYFAKERERRWDSGEKIIQILAGEFVKIVSWIDVELVCPKHNF